MRRLNLTWRLKNLLVIRRVVGHSMLPTLNEGKIIFSSSLLPIKHGSIVLADVGSRQVVKRYINNEGDLLLVGDNKSDSTDYSVSETDILGVVLNA